MGHVSTRTRRRRIERISATGDGPAGAKADLLAVEEPLEIRIGGQALTVTMRTPGDDLDLAAGFLFTEGLLSPAVDLRQIRMCDENVADATLGPPGLPAPAALERATDTRRAQRNFLTTSACGVCGKESIDAIRVRSRYDLATDRVRVSPSVLASLPDRLREAQRVFASTGGLHAAGLFGADGTLLVLREDVGRHNAVDKVIGWALRAGRLPLTGHVLLVSGRASFELVQKAAVAGIPVLAAVSAPSSLAADLADETGMTLVGFLRGSSMNAYTGVERITGVPAPA
ncbi:MAG TPA: formate dehydrogenase accessory sulfurtransferase FdhD [Streptosporangiaceae bacterium]|nr:formate dehydrogenase accessory sulfurtransferase FdhD [Streptosporangiaceae bacterium]